MSLSSMFKTDENAEQNGVRIEIGDSWFMVARTGGSNRKFKVAFERISRPFRRQLDLGLLRDEQQETLVMEAFAEAGLLGWGGVKLSDLGEPFEGEDAEVPYSKDNAVRLFRNLPQLFDLLLKDSQNHEIFRADIREAESKN